MAQTLFWDAYRDRGSAARFLAEVTEKHPWFMAICLDTVPVGTITMDKKTGSASCRAELGYVLARARWNQGIGTVAIGLTLERGFADLGISRMSQDYAEMLKTIRWQYAEVPK